jgi:two-component system cell cycle response regulator DivK
VLRKTVLVVDDTEDIAELVAILLRMTGCNAITARNGREAIEVAVEHKPDLILMDIRMPIMDGYEATRRILAVPELSRTPIVAVSAHCDGDWAVRARAAGCVECINKTVEPDQLRSLVATFIGICEGEQDAYAGTVAYIACKKEERDQPRIERI